MGSLAGAFYLCFSLGLDITADQAAGNFQVKEVQAVQLLIGVTRGRWAWPGSLEQI